jgi:hypothetical protein
MSCIEAAEVACVKTSLLPLMSNPGVRSANQTIPGTQKKAEEIHLGPEYLKVHSIVTDLLQKAD